MPRISDEAAFRSNANALAAQRQARERAAFQSSWDAATAEYINREFRERQARKMADYERMANRNPDLVERVRRAFAEALGFVEPFSDASPFFGGSGSSADLPLADQARVRGQHFGGEGYGAWFFGKNDPDCGDWVRQWVLKFTCDDQPIDPGWVAETSFYKWFQAGDRPGAVNGPPYGCTQDGWDTAGDGFHTTPPPSVNGSIVSFGQYVQFGYGAPIASGPYAGREWREMPRAYYAREFVFEPCPAAPTALDGVMPERNPNRMRAVSAPRNEASREEPAPVPPIAQMREWGFVPPFGVVPPPYAGSTPRRPPRRGEREPPKSRGWIQRLLKVADMISEAAEVVDGIFEALPCEIQKKAMEDCRAKAQFIDAAGQYGIDQADCKLEAIFDNYDLVDMEIALSNIMRNEIEDRIYGSLHKYLPRNTGGALDNVDMDFDDYDRRGEAVKGLSAIVDFFVSGASDAFGLTPPRQC